MEAEDAAAAALASLEANAQDAEADLQVVEDLCDNYAAENLTADVK